MFNVHINDGIAEVPKDDILYIIAKEGIFLKKKLGIFESIAPVDQISILQGIDSYAKMYIKPMKGKQFAQIIALFKVVLEKYRGEANIILHYHEENGTYKIEVPSQQVTGASVEYNSLKTFPGYLRIGTIHSHATMGAFHSGTDQSDEIGWDGIHITIGKLNQEFVDISASIMVNGTRFMIDPCDYVKGLELVEYEKPSYRTHTIYTWDKEVEKLVAKEPEKKVGLGYRVKNIIIEKVKIPKKWIKQINKYIPKSTPGYVIGAFGQHLYPGGSPPPNHQGYYHKGKFIKPTGNKELDRLIKLQTDADTGYRGYNARYGGYGGFGDVPGFDYSQGIDVDYSACEYCPHEDGHVADVFTKIIDGLDEDVVVKIMENLDDEMLKLLGFEEADGSPIDTIDDDLIVSVEDIEDGDNQQPII